MSKKSNRSNWKKGAVITASILGTLTSLILSKRNTNKGFIQKAKEKLNPSMEKNEIFNKNLTLGTIIGAVAGVTTALLLAPKSGTELLQDISQPFESKRKTVRSTPRKKTVRATTKRRQVSRSTTTRKGTKKGKKTTSSKKTHSPSVTHSIIATTEKTAHSFKS